MKELAMQKELQSEKNANLDHSTNHEKIRSENSTLNTKITELTAKNQGLQDAIKDRDMKLDETNAQLREQSKRNGELEHEVARITANNSTLREKYDRKKAEAAEEGGE